MSHLERARRAVLGACALLSIGGLAAGQIAPDEAVVALRTAGPATTELWTIDISTGVVAQLPRFPMDNQAVTAIALDPVDRSLLLTMQGDRATHLVRLRYRDRRLLRAEVEAVLLAGIARVAVTHAEWITLRGFPSGSIDVGTRWPVGSWSLPRGWLSAMHTEPDRRTMRAVVGQPLNGTFATFEVDLQTRQLVPGSTIQLPRLVNGVAEMPGGAADIVFSHPDGTFSRLQPATSNVPFPVAITIPGGIGGVQAMRRAPWQTSSVFVLGTDRYPFLYEVDVNVAIGSNVILHGPAWNGIPVDFAPPFGRGASAVEWAGACPSQPAGLRPVGVPTLGGSMSLQFDLGAPGVGVGALVFGLGTTERRTLSGCPLLVDPEFVVPVVGNAQVVSVPVPVPLRLELIGATVHAQGLRQALLPFGSSNCVALHLDL